MVAPRQRSGGAIPVYAPATLNSEVETKDLICDNFFGAILRAPSEDELVDARAASAVIAIRNILRRFD